MILVQAYVTCRCFYVIYGQLIPARQKQSYLLLFTKKLKFCRTMLIVFARPRQYFCSHVAQWKARLSTSAIHEESWLGTERLSWESPSRMSHMVCDNKRGAVLHSLSCFEESCSGKIILAHAFFFSFKECVFSTILFTLINLHDQTDIINLLYNIESIVFASIEHVCNAGDREKCNVWFWRYWFQSFN